VAGAEGERVTTYGQWTEHQMEALEPDEPEQLEHQVVVLRELHESHPYLVTDGSDGIRLSVDEVCAVVRQLVALLDGGTGMALVKGLVARQSMMREPGERRPWTPPYPEPDDYDLLPDA
jgi:hypothetical protein